MLALLKQLIMRLAKIRKASHFDVVAILDLLREYRALMPYGLLQNADDAEHVTALLSEMMAGKGIVFVAEVDKKIVGVLVAGIMPSIWSSKHLLLTEFALLAKYLEEAIKLKEEGRITNFFISKMVNSPDLNYGRYGFQKLEEFWVM